MNPTIRRPTSRRRDGGRRARPRAQTRCNSHDAIPMNETTAVSSPAGDLILRPERDDDEAFRLELFCASRQPEFARLLAPDMLATIMRQQFTPRRSAIADASRAPAATLSS